MKLNHINLPVNDVAASCAFFERYFDFECTGKKGDDLIAILQGTDGFTLVLMANSFNRDGNTTFPDAFHIGFFVDSREQVAAIHNRLLQDGFEVGQAPAPMRGGYGFYFKAPGNILTEVTCNNIN
jgi:catechol 2,3-dioxygenase-like lactoylglutathione lyase family enzyme